MQQFPPRIKEAPPEKVAAVEKAMEAAKLAETKPHGTVQEPFIAEGAQKTAEMKIEEAKGDAKFKNRGDVEAAIVFDKYRDIKLQGSWEGQSSIRVPRWMAKQYFELSEEIAQLIMQLFPNNYFFLFYVDHSKIASAVAEVQEVLFNKVGKTMVRVIMRTCKIDEAREDEFLESVTGWDLIEVFLCIVEMNINNDMMRAMQKKFRRLLGERFALENVFPELEDIMDGHRNTASTASPTKNSLSFISMQ